MRTKIQLYSDEYLKAFIPKHICQNLHLCPVNNLLTVSFFQRQRQGRIIVPDSRSSGAAAPPAGSFPWLASLFLRLVCTMTKMMKMWMLRMKPNVSQCSPTDNSKVISRRPTGEAYFMCAATLITPTVTFAHKDCTKIYPKLFHENIAQKYYSKKRCLSLQRIASMKSGKTAAGIKLLKYILPQNKL